VHTRLQNPTRYHVQQMQQYLSSSEGNMAAATVQSLPSELTSNQQQQQQLTTAQSTQLAGSAPTSTDPDSPLSMGVSSAATSVSEVCYHLCNACLYEELAWPLEQSSSPS
jgi:hypothetical protein